MVFQVLGGRSNVALVIGIYLTALPAACLTLAFSSGLSRFGEVFTSFVQQHVDYTIDSFSAGIAMLVLAYLLDMHLWKNCAGIVATLYLSFAGIILGVGVLLFSTYWPSLALVLGVALIVSTVGWSRSKVFKNHDVEDFSVNCSIAFMAQAVTWLVVWILWLFVADPKIRFNLQNISLPELNTFFLWCSPLILSVIFMMMSVALLVRADLYRHHPGDSEDAASMDLKHITGELKMTLLGMAIALAGVWVAAAIAAQDMGLQHTILRIAIFFSAGLLVYIFTSIGYQRIVAAAVESKMLKEASDVLHNDWVKALCLIFFWPLVPVYFLIEAIHQGCRYLFSMCGVLDAPKSGYVTEEAQLHLQHALEVNKTSVLTKSIVAGVIYFLMQAMVSVGITIFLAWLVDLILLWDPVSTMVTLCIVGIVLFLLPPVPGMPIYLASAVLLVAQGQRKGAATFWRDLVIAVVLSMVIKLLAVALQQKLIGYPFSESVAIKKTIGVQTSVMKAAKHVLKRPGLDFDKVCVLVSGPDWPTSVFTGVLDLPLLQMLIGTTPVFFLILPVVVSGAYMARIGTTPEENAQYSFAASLAASVGVILQAASGVIFCVRVHALTEEYKDEIASGEWEKDPQEEEVKAALKADEEAGQRYEAKVQWERVPFLVQACLIFGSMCMAGMMHLLLLPVFDPFAKFSVVDHISDLPGGTVLGAINRDGWFAVLCMSVGSLALTVFHVWASYAPEGEAQPLIPKTDKVV
mmetsp:Transcript_58155/g.107381  ORF Transcript_58155/g.107381 Transcript_58155/m.107381 type:complete len:747 (+) Transcript_58155:113-2353(+)